MCVFICISLASKQKNVLVNGDSIAKVSAEGCSTKNHSVKGYLKNVSFLPFYNLKDLLSPQRTFCETERLFGC